MKLKRLVGSQRIESHKHLLDWVITKWRKVARNYEEETEEKSKTKSEEGASAQISDKMSKSTSDPDSERKRLAAERRKKIMEQMAMAQKNFMKENATMFDDDEKSKVVNKESESPNDGMDTSEGCKTSNSDGTLNELLALGPKRTSPNVTETNFTCILCQEEDKLEPEGKALVMASFVQKSTVLSNKRNAISGEGIDSNASKTEGTVIIILMLSIFIFS